ncbi:ArnT family glycosyltransferase [Thermocoleostomius sinensis]|uniref:Glycosyltransferase family 39 protein n=1 Tax=Thermocoleostomius sinensis A174 TaxID=2016057 RepID=A0A9E8ZFX7_9CYAN|nr:glycosyltransferase family 39 protein [Thermocoleostomius sinensis]WAL60495.1 glycosyltransferase family 39 protein [Thermocoleostomius sinensis A174]
MKDLLAHLERNRGLAYLLATLWVGLIVWIVAWFRLNGIGLVDETEPLFAEAARQMVVTGDWITPYFNQVTRFDKPPLVYWLMAVAYQMVGVNEWSVRFPSALAITVLTGFSFYTLYQYGFPRPSDASNSPQGSDAIALPSAGFEGSRSSRWFSALIGSAAIGLNPQTFLWSRTGVSDMLLSGCMGAALLSFFCAYAQPEKPPVQARWYWAFYGFSALAVLTKGPVGIVLPGLIILVFLLYMGNWRAVLREMNWVWGSVVFLLITLPWYIAVIWINGSAFTDSFFGYHNIERFTSVVNNHWAPWYFYFIVVPVSFLPWSAHLPVAMARLRVWQRQHWQQQPRSTHLGIFALVWFAVIFVFFTIAVTKLPSYTIPLLPAAGILVGLFWADQMTRSRSSRVVRVSHWLNLILFVTLAIAAWLAPNWLGNDPEMPDLPTLVQQSGVLQWATIIWAIAAITGGLLLWRRQGQWLWSINLLGLIAFMLMTLIPTAVIVDAQRQLPLRQLAATIVQVQRPNEPVVMIGFSKPSLVFYTQRSILYFPDIDRVHQQLRRLARQTTAADSLLLVGRSLKLEEAELSPDKYQVIEQAGVYQLVRINLADRSGLRAED